MPFIGTAVATAVLGAGAAGTLAFTLVSSAANIALSVGLNYVGQALLGGQQSAPLNVGSEEQVQLGGLVPRTFCVGQWATEGSLVYVGTWGEVNDVDNAFQTRVYALSDMPDDVESILVDGEPVTWDRTGTGNHNGEVTAYTNDNGPHLWVRVYDGTQTTADAQLVANFGAHETRPWTSAMVGRGVCYAIVTALVAPALLNRFPTVKFVLKGAKLYDVRKDTTAGGSGSHRWSTPSTWERTSNPVVIAYNILRGISYGGEWQWGGRTIGAGQLPLAEWAAAANVCDTVVAKAGGGTEAQYRCGGMISYADAPADVLDRLMMTCNGRIAEVGGVYKAYAGAVGSATMAITDGAILSTEQQTFTPFHPLDESANGISARYVSPDEAWAPKEAPPRIVDAWVAEDDGRQMVASVDYQMVSSATQVQRLMDSALKEARRNRRHTLPLPPEAFILEPGDVISWSSDRNGYEAKLFRVDAVRDMANLNVIVDVTEGDPADYDWDPDVDELPWSDAPSISIDRPAPQPINDWYAEGVTIPGDGGLARAGIRLSWDPTVHDVDGIQYRVRLKATAVQVLESETDAFEAGAIVVGHNILPATVYEVQGRYRPASDRETTWSGWLEVTTPDIRIDPAELSAQTIAEIDLLTNQAQGSLDALRQQVRTLLDRIAADAAQEAAEAYESRREIQQSLVASLGQTRATLLSFQEVVATDQAALAHRIDVAEASTAQNAADILSEIEARTDGESATAALLTAVQAMAGQASAEGFYRLVATASPGGGVSAQFIVQLNAGTVDGPDWKFAGFYLQLLTNGSARAVFRVDNFTVADPVTMPSGVSPFQIIGGSVYIRDTVYAQKIIANSISTNELQVGSVQTPNILQNAVTNIVTASADANITTDPRISATITRTPGTKLKMQAWFSTPNTAHTASSWSPDDINKMQPRIRFYRGSTLLKEVIAAIGNSVSGTTLTFAYQNLNVIWVDDANLSGSYTYSVHVRRGALGTTPTQQANNENFYSGQTNVRYRFLELMEVKR